MANLVPLIALAAGAFFLLKRDRTEGLLGHGLEPGIHDVKVGETLVLRPSKSDEEVANLMVTMPGPDGEAIATASEFMAVFRGAKRPEVTFLKDGSFKVSVFMGAEDEEQSEAEYAFNVSEPLV